MTPTGGAPGASRDPALVWRADDRLQVGGVDFVLAPSRPRGVTVPPGALLLRKARWMVECYDELRRQIDAPRIFELGIYEGGSTALLALLFRPEKLVAVDLRPEPVVALTSFLRDHALESSVRPYVGVDQADRARLTEILEAEGGTAPLDLVIDDASHHLVPTTSSFNLLFPRLRPGGLYVLEDWSWQHDIERKFDSQPAMSDRALGAIAERIAGTDSASLEVPMSRLLLELVITAGYDESIVAEVGRLRRGWVTIRRGDASLDPETFAIEHSYGELARTLLAPR